MSKLQIPILESYEWQKAVLDNTLSEPPISPIKGARYIIASNPSGAWYNKPKQIAEYIDENEWKFTKPKQGMLTLVASTNILYQYINNKWRNFALLINSKKLISTKSEDYNISIDDGGMFFVADTESEITFTLPSVSSSDLGLTFSFARVNKLSNVIIQANDNDHIADSGEGCTIHCNDQDIEYATLTLTLIQDDRWAILNGNGIWTTTVLSE